MLTLAVAAAVALAPLADPTPPPMQPVEGVVMWMQQKPGCNLLNLGDSGWGYRKNVCVPAEQYANTHWMDYFRGVGRPA